MRNVAQVRTLEPCLVSYAHESAGQRIHPDAPPYLRERVTKMSLANSASRWLLITLHSTHAHEILVHDHAL